MDSSLIQSVWTVVVMVLFVGIVIWAWSGKRKQDFEEAAHLPFDEEDSVPVNKISRRIPMADFTSSFWNWFIIIPTIGGIIACFLLIRWLSTSIKAEDLAKPMGHVWDEDLAQLVVRLEPRVVGMPQ